MTERALDGAALAEHATAIRALLSRTVKDVAEIGRRLIEAKSVVGRGKWLPWLDREFGWSEDTAENFMRVHKFVDGLSNSETIRNLVLTLPVSSVYLLAAPSTPAEARDEIIERAEAGEVLLVPEVKRVIQDAKPPKKRRTTLGRARPVKRKRRTTGSSATVKRLRNRDLYLRGDKDRKEFRGKIIRFVDRLIQVDVGVARELRYLIVNTDFDCRNYLAEYLDVVIQVAETGGAAAALPEGSAP
jgi:Protein of unknown function (DUF3102)